MKPEPIGFMLPKNVMRILGIRVAHSVGYQWVQYKEIRSDSDTRGEPGAPPVTQRVDAPIYDPSIGWMYLELNNRKRPLGNFNVEYNPHLTDVRHFQELDIEVERGSMVTGLYMNEAYFPASSDGVTKYIVAIYFNCLCDDEGQDIDSIIDAHEDHHIL